MALHCLQCTGCGVALLAMQAMQPHPNEPPFLLDLNVAYYNYYSLLWRSSLQARYLTCFRWLIPYRLSSPCIASNATPSMALHCLQCTGSMGLRGGLIQPVGSPRPLNLLVVRLAFARYP